MSFPRDSYTPYGYLDTPTHTRNVSPRGVLRSFDAGFRWHYPAYAGLYGGRREVYRAGLRLAIDGALTLSNFDHVESPYHSKNIVTFDLTHGPAQAQVSYHLANEHALRAIVELKDVQRAALHIEYTRLLSANGEWGESGLVGRTVEEGLVLQGFEDGDAFVLWTSHSPNDSGISPDEEDTLHWVQSRAPGLPEEGYSTVIGRRGDTVSLHAVLGFSPEPAERLEIILARGKTLAEALHHLIAARRDGDIELARLRAEDEAFWSKAPRLEGDWPAHWRRGSVYDLETLRMMVKQPIGIYRHIWDAMQIQAPRVVLAETAIDALLLGYADPALAQQLMLGTFTDAPEPYVPCTREDGTYNMVAADGTACGTAPEWGYPWLVLDWLYALHPDSNWLAQIYPRLGQYLDWWLAHRRNADGWLFYACSWESGQDGSQRFGHQPLGGGHPVRHVWPVDLHAAFAHAAQVMARFAGTLGYTHDVPKWQGIAEEFTKRTGKLWDGTRYADFDSRTGRFSDVDDVMLLAPLALGIADTHTAMQQRPTITGLDPTALTWPMFVWTAVEAALTTDLIDTAAHLAGAICERAYRFWDTRQPQPKTTLPGIACEYWPTSGRCGGEGYGWGAFALHLVLHVLVGITPTTTTLRLRPNLPLDLRQAGRCYRVHLQAQGRTLQVALTSLGHDRVAVAVNHCSAEIAWGDILEFSWDQLDGDTTTP